MTSPFFKRLTPMVPGEAGAFHIESQARVVTGFVSGGPTDGLGYPQWAIRGWSVCHYFSAPDFCGVTRSLCGRLTGNAAALFRAGNFARCKDCERRYTKELRKR